MLFLGALERREGKERKYLTRATEKQAGIVDYWDQRYRGNRVWETRVANLPSGWGRFQPEWRSEQGWER